MMLPRNIIKTETSTLAPLTNSLTMAKLRNITLTTHIQLINPYTPH